MSATVEHIFRQHYGLLVAALTRRVGAQHLAAIEDAVQYATIQALEAWLHTGTPENPAGWLYKVAYRQLLTGFRTTNRHQQLLAEKLLIIDEVSSEADIPLKGEMADALLQMLFVTCDEKIPTETQLVFTLKALCGFSVREIATRLFTSEENIYKRFARAKQFFEKSPRILDTLSHDAPATRLDSVHKVIYLIFTEGYLSSHQQSAIRKDLCEEAIHLALMLSKSVLGNMPQTHALLALMYLHLARFDARQNGTEVLLFEEQDRSLWDKTLITTGLNHLEQSAQGKTLSRYHLEANIAAEHCMAKSFAATRWDNIVKAYERLETITQSPMIRLSKAIAIAELKGAQTGLTILETMQLPVWLNRSYHWYATKADLMLRAGQKELAQPVIQEAIALAPNPAIKSILQRRLGIVEDPSE